MRVDTLPIVAHLRPRLLRVKVDPPVQLSFASMSTRTVLLIEAEDRDGRTGYGECWANLPHWTGEERLRLARRVIDILAEGGHLSGAVSYLEVARKRLLPSARQAGTEGALWQVLSGLDTARLDLHARQLGISVASLLGGRCRSSVGVYGSSIQPHDPASAERMAELDFDHVKCRVGFGSDLDVATVAAARQAVGNGGEVYADANRAWNLTEALVTLERLAEFGLTWIEEPLIHDRPRELRHLAHKLGIAVALGENRYGMEGFVDLLDSSAVQVWQPDVAKVGGVAEMDGICRLAQALGVTVTPHWYGGPVALAATLQVAARRTVIDQVEYDVSQHVLHELVIPPLQPVQGRLAIPNGPGLGINIERDAIEEYEETP